MNFDGTAIRVYYQYDPPNADPINLQIDGVFGGGFFNVNNGVTSSEMDVFPIAATDYVDALMARPVPWLPGTTVACTVSDLLLRDDNTGIFWSEPRTFEVNPY